MYKEIYTYICIQVRELILHKLILQILTLNQ